MTIFTVCSRLATTLLNELLENLKNEEFYCLKIGFYAASVLKKLIMFVELIKTEEDFEKYKPIE